MYMQKAWNHAEFIENATAGTINTVCASSTTSVKNLMYRRIGIEREVTGRLLTNCPGKRTRQRMTRSPSHYLQAAVVIAIVSPQKCKRFAPVVCLTLRRRVLPRLRSLFEQSNITKAPITVRRLRAISKFQTETYLKNRGSTRTRRSGYSALSYN